MGRAGAFLYHYGREFVRVLLCRYWTECLRLILSLSPTLLLLPEKKVYIDLLRGFKEK